ncbi:Very long-chain fatty acid transport protein [Ceratocystis platani]|uniref:Very long-chain fatty acid transport protein n=1 Tax=Ceratocystis fimbriata f. sp. platani TaxID=88771 RepID=A0A0F8DF64_CERFI|nr:Very long-chain fatty acid transport protein [Ceratocystis platani]
MSAIAAAGLVGTAAYINARAGIWYDYHLVRSVIPSALRSFIRSRTNGLNQFYVLERWARSSSRASLPLIKFEGRDYTYAQTYAAALSYGTWLRESKGVKPGDIVAIDFQNSETFVFLWFGLWAIGAKPAFINYNLTAQPLAHCVRACKAKLVLADPLIQESFTESVLQSIPGAELVVVTPDLDTQIRATQGKRYPDQVRNEDDIKNIAMLIYTSGTTGLPKPAIISWGKATVSSNFCARLLRLTEKDVFFTAMPMYHSSASLLGFLNVLEAGSTIAISRKFSAKTFWDQVRQSDATVIHYVGETCRYLLGTPPQTDPETGELLDRKHRVHTAFGNGLRPDVWDKFKERFGIDYIAEWYASTEGPFAIWNLSRNSFTQGAIGRNGWIYNMLMSINVQVVEVDPLADQPWRHPKSGLCRKVKAGTPGELMFRLPSNDVESRFQGYYGNEDATNSKILRNVLSKGDAWFRTGDMVVWDNDGRVFFSDRIGDTFRWKSENVSTAEVGQIVGQHPVVHEANVYGVELPRHDGRCGCAAIVFTSDVKGQPSPEVLKSLADHVANTLPKYARPIFLRVMPEMEATSTFKQLKHGLRAQGVDPDKVDSGKMYWLKNGTYTPFTETDWTMMVSGGVKL